MSRLSWTGMGWLACLILAPVAAVGAGGGQLVLTVVDQETGELLPCRVHLTNEAGKARKAYGMPFFHDHFTCPGTVTLKLPKGGYRFTVESGPEYVTREGHFTINDFADDEKTVELQRICDMAAEGWWAGDLAVRRDADDLDLLMQAEGLDLVEVIGWDNSTPADAAPPAESRLTLGPHRVANLLGGSDISAGGWLLLLRGTQIMRLPPAGHEEPPSLEIVERFRGQEREAWIDPVSPAGWDLPVWLAYGAIDSFPLAGPQLLRDKTGPEPPGSRPRDMKLFPGKLGAGLQTQEIYYHLLNCGFRFAPTAASGSGDVNNPIGYNRVYVYLGPEFSREAWWQGLARGAAMVTNGPLLRPLVSGQRPGHVFYGDEGETIALETSLNLSTRDKIDYLEIVKDGLVERAVRLDELAKRHGQLPALEFTHSGWFLIRAVTNVQETYRFASTAPYYVEIGDESLRVSRASAEFFLNWAKQRRDRVAKLDPLPSGLLELHDHTVDFWEQRVSRAEVP